MRIFVVLSSQQSPPDIPAAKRVADCIHETPS
jgi:hypothetical protein